eukprot:scaffold5138_cov125-Isochrysis_galbana.AAC.8
MGAIAKSLGLTDTAGAFAAGVLLANTNYRAQIQADILPFKGILLGVFFMDAGSSFDVDLALAQLPVVLAGAAGLVALKAITLGLATRVPRWLEPKRLPPADGLRLALLLSGGGEFAFVVLALAEKLKVHALCSNGGRPDCLATGLAAFSHFSLSRAHTLPSIPPARPQRTHIRVNCAAAHGVPRLPSPPPNSTHSAHSTALPPPTVLSRLGRCYLSTSGHCSPRLCSSPWPPRRCWETWLMMHTPSSSSERRMGREGGKGVGEEGIGPRARIGPGGPGMGGGQWGDGIGAAGRRLVRPALPLLPSRVV